MIRILLIAIFFVSFAETAFAGVNGGGGGFGYVCEEAPKYRVLDLHEPMAGYQPRHLPNPFKKNLTCREHLIQTVAFVQRSNPKLSTQLQQRMDWFFKSTKWIFMNDWPENDLGTKVPELPRCEIRNFGFFSISVFPIFSIQKDFYEQLNLALENKNSPENLTAADCAGFVLHEVVYSMAKLQNDYDNSFMSRVVVRKLLWQEPDATDYLRTLLHPKIGRSCWQWGKNICD